MRSVMGSQVRYALGLAGGKKLAKPESRFRAAAGEYHGPRHVAGILRPFHDASPMASA